MSDDSQFIVPPSFIALFIDPGRHRPREPRSHIAERYELCEDLAQMLTDTARDKLWQLGITEADVLARMHAGLLGGELGLAAAEAGWVVQRLAELLEWPMPVIEPPPAASV
jgi:hypothetical protein